MGDSFPLDFILENIGGSISKIGDYSGLVKRISSLSDAEKGDLSFYYDPKYIEQLESTKASVVIVPKDINVEPKPNQLYLVVENPSLSFARICREIELNISPKIEPGIHPSAVIHPSAIISEEAFIGPLCCVGEDAKIGAAILKSQISIGNNAMIGDGSILFPQVVVGPHCIVGKNNRLSEGSVIGSDGYGYIRTENGNERVSQIGIVETGNLVDIGANSTIDRARVGKTYIGHGTKIDNLVQVGHNAVIGNDCLLVAQTGVAGSSKLGENVILAGKAGVVGHLSIGANSIIGPMSCVFNSLEPNSNVMGTPAISKILYWRMFSLSKKLPNLFKQIKNRIID